jgi:S-methylmethionine-dependent homocysteine/selenocysteine methylase
MIVIDGATGTELARRGVDTRGPLFSAAGLAAGGPGGVPGVHLVHLDYARAGAQVVTAATFRTGPRAAGPRWRDLTRTAVRLAKASGALVAGSIAPVEDCYRPDLRPPAAIAFDEDRKLAKALAEDGCDLLLVETVAAADEGLAAVRAAVEMGLPVWVSAMASPAATMLSGDDLRAFFEHARAAGVKATLLNCTPCDGIDRALEKADVGLPFGAYANMGEVDPASGWPSTPVLSPEAYAARARAWLEKGATILGGCCGTTPAHIAALAGISPIRHDPCQPHRRLS